MRGLLGHDLPMRKPTQEQKEKARMRRQNLRAIAARIAKMSEAEKSALVSDWPTTIEGHRLSMCNALMIALQGGATVVGGFQQWKRAGRRVMKGGKSVGIWVPIGTNKKENADTGEISHDGEKVGFVFGTVFDISQTVELESAAA